MKQYSKVMDVLDHHTVVREVIEVSMNIDLPNWCIVGGLIRDLVWGEVFGRDIAPRDIDLIYFDEKDLAPETEWEIERKLQNISGLPFRVNNQARMHNFNSEAKYTCIADAMGKFPTTVSAIGLTGDRDRAPILFSVFGYSSLLKPVFQITPHFVRENRHSDFTEYLNRNKLFERWPEVPVVTGIASPIRKSRYMNSPYLHKMHTNAHCHPRCAVQHQRHGSSGVV